MLSSVKYIRASSPPSKFPLLFSLSLSLPLIYIYNNFGMHLRLSQIPVNRWKMPSCELICYNVGHSILTDPIGMDHGITDYLCSVRMAVRLTSPTFRRNSSRFHER